MRVCLDGMEDSDSFQYAPVSIRLIPGVNPAQHTSTADRTVLVAMDLMPMDGTEVEGTAAEIASLTSRNAPDVNVNIPLREDREKPARAGHG